MLEHDFECKCEYCMNEFQSQMKYKNMSLYTAKIIELAEQESGLKQEITECLKQFPNYNLQCDCTTSPKKLDRWLIEDVGDKQYRDVCCICGGLT